MEKFVKWFIQIFCSTTITVSGISLFFYDFKNGEDLFLAATLWLALSIFLIMGMQENMK